MAVKDHILVTNAKGGQAMILLNALFHEEVSRVALPSQLPIRQKKYGIENPKQDC